MARVIIQKEDTRYTFSQSNGRYCIITEKMFQVGGSMSFRYVSKEEGNRFYLESMAEGFKRFRNIYEVSWYATRENNTPYAEEWIVDGNYLIPIKSRVLKTA